jgi:hypothetical protein
MFYFKSQGIFDKKEVCDACLGCATETTFYYVLNCTRINPNNKITKRKKI